MTLRGAQLKLKENRAQTENTFEVVKRLQAIRQELLEIKENLGQQPENHPAP